MVEQRLEHRTVVAPSFIGTTGLTPLDFSVNNVRGLRIQPSCGGGSFEPKLNRSRVDDRWRWGDGVLANMITNKSERATIAGGRSNVADAIHTSFGAGNRAKAINAGAFVWADSQNAASDDETIAPLDEAGVAFASIRALYEKVETENRTLQDENADNFGAYASDCRDDDWQALYFGQSPNASAAPTADPDGDGRNNRFEFLSGFFPTDAVSAFHFHDHRFRQPRRGGAAAEQGDPRPDLQREGEHESGDAAAASDGLYKVFFCHQRLGWIDLHDAQAKTKDHYLSLLKTRPQPPPLTPPPKVSPMFPNTCYPCLRSIHTRRTPAGRWIGPPIPSLHARSGVPPGATDFLEWI